MLTWNVIETDFGGETTNFGPRNEGGCSLYQVDTLATISPQEDDESSECPGVCICSHDKNTCVAVDRFVTVFHDGVLKGVVECDGAVETLQWSSDNQFVVIGDDTGCVSVLPCTDHLVLCTLNLGLAGADHDGRIFHKICITESDGCYDILCLLSNGQLFLLQRATVEVFLEAQEENFNLLDHLSIVQTDTLNVHSATNDVLFLDDHIVTMGCGDSILAVWDASTLATTFDVLDPVGLGGIIKGRATSDSSTLICLHDTGVVTAWESQHFIMLPFYHDSDISDFEIVEGVQMDLKGLQGYRLVTLTLFESKSELQVFDMCDMSLCLIYTLELHRDTLLGSISPHDTICMLEGCSADADYRIGQLRFRCLTESDPEIRLYRLLRKQHFEEAEKFALLYQLDINIVRIARVKHILHQVNHLHLSLSHSDLDSDKLLLQLWSCLDRVTVNSEILELTINIVMPTLEQTEKILRYAQNKLQVALTDTDNDTDVTFYSQLFSQLTSTKRRLCTYKYIEGSNDYSAESWREYQGLDMCKKMLYLLASGDLETAVEIWKRHRCEWGEMNSTLVDAILSRIPDHVTCTQLCDWLCDDLIPCVIRSTPEDLRKVVAWLESRIINMQTLGEGWPQSALDFTTAIYKACSAITDSSHDCIPSVIKRKICIRYTETLEPLRRLIKIHSDLLDLTTLYNFSLTYDQIICESTESIAWRMLDRVVSVQLMEATLEKQIRPYIVAHDLSEDDIYSRYVPDMLMRRSNMKSYTQRVSLWEVRAVAIIGFINDPRVKLSAIYELVNYVTLPWSDEVRRVVNAGLDLNLPEVAKLRSTSQWMEVRMILLKYEYRIVKEEAVKAGIYYVLRCDRPTSMSDALEMARRMELDSLRDKIYAFRARFLVLHDRLDEAIDLLTSLPPPQAMVTCRHLLLYTEVLLNEPHTPATDLNVNLQNVNHTFAHASVAIAGVLYKLLDDELEKAQIHQTRTRMRSIYFIQRDYNLQMSLLAFSEPLRCEDILTGFIQQSLETSGDIQLMTKRKFYRLCELLGVDRMVVDTSLINHYLEGQDIDAVLHTSLELFGACPTPSTAQLLYDTAKDLIHLLTHPGLTLTHLNNIPHAAHTLACHATQICDSSLMRNCLELCRVIHLMVLCAQHCDTGGHVQFVDMSGQGRKKREWTPVITVNEDSLVLDGSVVFPILSHYITSHMTFIESCSLYSPASAASLDSLDISHSHLIEVLQQYNHSQLSLDMVIGHKAAILCHSHELMLSIIHTEDDVKESVAQLLHTLCLKAERLFHCYSPSLLDKQVKTVPIDHASVLCVALSLPKQITLKWLKKTLFSYTSSYRALKVIAEIGEHISQIYKMAQAQTVCSDYENIAYWGHRLSKYKICYKDNQPGKMAHKLRILHELALCDLADLPLVKEYCTSFDGSDSEYLLIYLKHLLDDFSTSRDTLTPSRAGQLVKATRVIGEIHSTVGLSQLLLNAHNEADPYNYEFIEFLLGQLISFEEEIESIALVSKGIQLMQSIKFYKRRSSPLDIERRYKNADGSMDKIDHEMNPLAKQRLPYHLLLQEPWKIIRPELDLTTVGMWVPLATILKLKIDHIYFHTILKCFTSFNNNANTSAVSKHSGWTLHSMDRDLITSAMALFSKASDPFEGLSYTSLVIKDLTNGAAKCMVIKQSIELARRSWEQLSEENPQMKAYQGVEADFTVRWQLMATKQILHQHKLDDAHLYKLSKKPLQLIQKLYEHPSIVTDTVNAPDIELMCREIADVYSINLTTIRHDLVTDWLPPLAEKAVDLDNTTVSFDMTSFTQSNAPDDEGDDERFTRVMYLLKCGDIEDSLTFLQNYIYERVESYDCKVRAMKCLLQLIDRDRIRDLGVTLEAITEEVMVYLYLSDLEKINIRHSDSSFRKCDKIALAKGLWSNSRHKKKGQQGKRNLLEAVQLVANLCLDYCINDTTLINSVLSQLYTFGSMSELEVIVDALQNRAGSTHIPCLPRVWQGLIEMALVKGHHEEHKYNKAINLLKRCPVVTQLNLGSLSQKFDHLKLYDAAAFCDSFL